MFLYSTAVSLGVNRDCKLNPAGFWKSVTSSSLSYNDVLPDGSLQSSQQADINTLVREDKGSVFTLSVLMETNVVMTTSARGRSSSRRR